MTLPDVSWLVQVDWDDADLNPPWSAASVNTYTANMVQRLDVERRSFRGSLRSDTASVTVLDEDLNIRPSKDSSALSPNVVLGRRIRILGQTALGSGVWEPWYFGYLRDYQPLPTDANPPTTVLLADGPLASLAAMHVTLSPSFGAVVWDADDPYHTGLWHLLNEAGLWGSAMLDLDNVGQVALPLDWAGTGEPDIADPTNWQTKTFGEWLGILCKRAKCFVAAEPRIATTVGDPDFVLHWYQTSPGADVDFSWSAPNRQLELTPQLSYNGIFSF